MSDGPFRDNNLDAMRKELALVKRENELLAKEKEHYRKGGASQAWFKLCRYSLAAASLGALMVTGNGWCLLLGFMALVNYDKTDDDDTPTSFHLRLGGGGDLETAQLEAAQDKMLEAEDILAAAEEQLAEAVEEAKEAHGLGPRPPRKLVGRRK